MPEFRNFQTNFTAGVLSPRLEGRTDLQRYPNGVKTLTNMIVFVHGGTSRRPGTKYVAETKDSTVKSRLIAFEFSTTQAYILEFGNAYIRFYKDSGQITSGGSAYQITSPYATADLPSLKFAQSADTLYIAHPSYAPRKLTRTGHTAWTLTTIAFTDGPYLEAKDDLTITPSAVTGTGITLTASAAFFNTDSPSKHIDALIRLKHLLVPGTPTVTPQGTTGSISYAYRVTSLDTVGESTRSAQGTTTTGNATLSQANFNRVTWTAISGAKAYRIYGRVANAELFIAEVPSGQTTFDDIGGITPNGAAPKTDTTDTWGYAKITAVASATSATADVKTDFGNTTASNKYREGAWSTQQGFPGAVSFFEDRLAFAGSTNQPQNAWLSKSGSYEEHTPGTKDDDAINEQLASGQVDVIRWVQPGEQILIGTVGGEWTAGAADPADPVTPTNFAAKARTAWGSSGIAGPIRLGSVTLFTQRSGRKVRELTFALESNTFVAPDLTVLAEHLFGPSKTIADMAFAKEPDPILWVVRSDGELCGMTYDRSQDVVGWHEQITGPLQDLTDGKFESVAVIPHPDADRDQVWVIVNRTIAGATKRYVEFFETKGIYYDEQEVDSGLVYDGAKATVLTLGAKTGNDILFTTTGGPFVAADVGRFIHEIGGKTGRAEIKTFTDTNNIRCDISSAFSSTSIAASKWGIAVTSVTGLEHLNGTTVRVVGDGSVYNDVVVAAGKATLTPSEPAVKIEVGLDYPSTVKTLRPEVQVQGGTTQALLKRVTTIAVRLYKTLGATVNDEIIPFRKAGDAMNRPPPVFSGEKIKTNLGYDREGLITIQQTQPLPLTVVGIIGTVQIGER